jgi:hypothetical protein
MCGVSSGHTDTCRLRRPQWTGDPECYECGNQYEPLSGDGDGLCWHCYNEGPDPERVAPWLREQRETLRRAGLT